MDGRDWFAVVDGGGACPDCGFAAAAVARRDLGPSLMGEARRWDELLRELGADDAAIRRRPSPSRWSAIEYAGHVAGVLDVFAGRVERLRAAPDDGIDLGWWDHEAAVTEERYADWSVADAVAAIGDGAVHLALALPRPEDGAAWERWGVRRGGERFSIDGLVRFALHESAHHRVDARHAVAPVTD